jgi:hypothetical protein
MVPLPMGGNPMTEISITGDLRARSCPTCNHLDRQMAEFFAERQGLLSKSEEARTDYADQGGFCPLHTWQLAAFSSPRGISRGHSSIIRRMAESLDRAADAYAERKAGVFPVKAADGCMVCRFLADTEAHYIEAFSAFLEEDGNLERYRRSYGLCLQHLQPVLDRMVDGSRKAYLIRLAANRLREISESMVQYDLKLEQLKRELLTRDEKDAYRRGLVMLSGERTVFSPFMKGI